jgi:hypothetical protein
MLRNEYGAGMGTWLHRENARGLPATFMSDAIAGVQFVEGVEKEPARSTASYTGSDNTSLSRLAGLIIRSRRSDTALPDENNQTNVRVWCGFHHADCRSAGRALIGVTVTSGSDRCFVMC